MTYSTAQFPWCTETNKPCGAVAHTNYECTKCRFYSVQGHRTIHSKCLTCMADKSSSIGAQGSCCNTNTATGRKPGAMLALQGK